MPVVQRIAVAILAIVCILVVHEFVHFLYPNHSKEFYSCLEKYLPDWKTRKKELETYSRFLK